MQPVIESPHARSIEDVAALLETSERGLDAGRIADRLAKYGYNEIQQIEPISIPALILHQFTSPLIYILVAACFVTLALGEYIDAGVIAVVLIINATIGFIQEYRAERSVRALMELTAPMATVIRDGKQIVIESRLLVPGDVVIVESGTRVPADIRLFHALALQVDESMLTGESVPVYKQVAAVPSSAPIGDRTNMLYAGTIVASGRGRGYVVATGYATELGAIATSMRQQQTVQTPLQQRMYRFANLLGIVIGIACALIFGIGLLVGHTPIAMFQVIVGVAVAAIPEGLPIVLTIALALRVRQMAKRNALVRRLHAVETLGSTTVIGSDKTGTLTENRMRVEEYWIAGEHYRVSQLERVPISPDDDHPFVIALLTSVLTSEAEIYYQDDDTSTGHGDPTEVALLLAALEAGLRHDHIHQAHPLIAAVPFEPELQYSASLRRRKSGNWLFVKGAPERLLAMASTYQWGNDLLPLDKHAQHTITNQASQMASRGLRVLGLAYHPDWSQYSSDREPIVPANLIFLGLVGLIDPPRVGVKEAIEDCKRAGIRVVMITGDHAATASAIAAELGIADLSQPYLTGTDLDAISDEELRDHVRSTNVYARVSPQHKLRIVQALKANGETVAVTGDGVNDAPALRAADVGVAMGKGGTDVAREAADIVLADDNFVTIRNAIEEGRIAFKNVRNATFFLISTGAAAILIFLIAVLGGMPLPMVPAQLLWLNLVTNGLQDVAMAFEPGDRSILDQPPRPRQEGIISPLLWERTVLVGILMAVATIALFWYELETTGSLTRAQTVALTTMVLFQNFHVGNSRSEFRSVFFLNPLRNKLLVAAVVAALAIHIAALYVPATQFILRVEPIEWEAWLRSIMVALSVVVTVELHKWLRYPHLARTGI